MTGPSIRRLRLVDAEPPAHPVAGFAESTPGPFRPEAWTETDAEMVLRVAHD